MRLLLATILACFASQAGAQQIASPVSSIRVIGEAVITTKPDRAQLDVGVVSQAPQSQAAADRNAQQLDAVLAALHKALGGGADIKTIDYALNPNYQFHPSGGPPTITGYTATNVVRVTVDDLSKIGNVLDGATAAGANHVQGIQFTLRDQQAVRSQALREAATKARAEADALAAALNLRIVRILTVEESGPAQIPLRGAPIAMRAESASAPTPVQAGTLEVTANVTLTVEVAPR